VTPAEEPVLPPLREVIAAHGLSAEKRLGQHFLLDGNITDRIAQAAGSLTGVNVVEIGPGPGGLTRSLLRTEASRIVAVERDSRCIAALQDLAACYPARLDIVEGDALELDPVDLVAAPRRIVANLPYNVSVPLILGWLGQADRYAGFTLMVQKEVADRLSAAPGSKAFGRLSVIAQWLCDIRLAFTLGPRAFVPPPKVTSAVVLMTPLPRPRAEADRRLLEAVTAAAFGQRRKMLRSSLKSLGLDPAAVGIDPERRAETLSVEEFCALARQLGTRAGAVTTDVSNRSAD
jgi:16S rRNA (adenine1518-N6/adenine1519-N6)-dimethyltransferase